MLVFCERPQSLYTLARDTETRAVVQPQHSVVVELFSEVRFPAVAV